MKKRLLFFSIVTLLFACSKSKTLTPQANGSEKSVKLSLSLAPNIKVNATDWQHVLGGKAIVKFSPNETNGTTLSSLSENIDIKDMSAHSIKLINGAYDITLNTVSTAVADTFIRFNATAKKFTIKSDTTINLTASAADGVITIKKSIIAQGTKPTFTPAGTDSKVNFGLINDYYFLYVAGTKTGRVTFKEKTSDDVFMKDITVAAQNQYDITAVQNVLNGVDLTIHSFNAPVN